jgi:putative sterol carrier protein
MTRLTEDILPPDLQERLTPEFVTPLVLYLCAEACPVSGGIYNAGAGFFNRAAIVSGPGLVLGDGDVASPEQVAGAWEDIRSLAGAEEYNDAMALFGPMIDALEGKPRKAAGGTPAKEEAPAAAGGGISPADVFAAMPDHFAADAAAGVDVVFQYKLSGDGGGEWYTAIADQTCTVGDGVHERPTTTILMGAADFVALIQGKLDAMAAFTTGKLKIEGDLMKSQLIEKLFKF